MSSDELLGLLYSVARVGTPMVFAAMGGLLCERSGVVNIALEGMMLAGAFAAAAATHYSGSPWIGFWIGGCGGMLLASLYGLCTLNFRANQIVAGTGINIMAFGLTPFLCKVMFGSGGTSPSLPIESRFLYEPTVVACFTVLAIWAIFRWFPLGLWISVAGEKPEALDAAGVKVMSVRWFSVLAGGLLAGFGGASLAIYLSSSFARNMTSGRGFMALAALIFGKWKPIPAFLACLLFAAADVAQIRLQGVVLWGVEPVPVQFIQMLPYLITVIVLAGWVGRARAPAALGLPYDRR